MPSVTFLGQIQGGIIRTEQPLAEFEGKKVSVTVIVPETARPVNADEMNGSPKQEQLVGPDEPVLLEDLGRLRMPPRDVKTLKGRIIDVGQLPPRVYLSDEEA